MKKRYILLFLILALIIIIIIAFKINNNMKGAGIIVVDEMILKSSAFANEETIPIKYTCDGENVNPDLEIEDIPKGTKSFALIMDDPDASSGNFVHWVVWNIPSSTNIINENSIPEDSVQGRNGAGTNKYIGPCPPSGNHRYFFKVYALDKELDLDADSKKEDVEEAIKGHTIALAQLMGRYKRS